MSDLLANDYFTDASMTNDPYPYFEQLRSLGPVVTDPLRRLLMVTGYEEAIEIYNNSDAFSNANAVGGPFPELPYPTGVDDISDFIEAHRRELPMWDHLITFDGEKHAAYRGLMLRLLTPRRLRENEEFMWRLADRQLDEVLTDGGCEFVADYAQPFALLVIAELLGVPEEDMDSFRGQLRQLKPGSVANTKKESGRHNPLAFLEERFTDYVEDRRRSPRRDVLTGLATATFPDGSLADVADVVRIATFLFAAGQETSARHLSSALQYLAERPELQNFLRAHPERVADFGEEVLRLESPTKSDFRLTRRTTTVGGVTVPAGQVVILLPGAANRDPRHFEEPNSFNLDRSNRRTHIAFGRGAHACPGGSLARAEANVSVQRILERTTAVSLAEDVHGPVGARRFDYEKTYIMRGLHDLHVRLSPA